MTTATTPTRTATTVGDELALAHEGRMQQVATFLTPALSEEADFWTRWACARFLSDRFRDWFRRECGLLDALGPLVPEEGARGIAAARAALERTTEELVAASLGYIVPTAGALLQEAIDVGVILNALRAAAGADGRPAVSIRSVASSTSTNQRAS